MNIKILTIIFSVFILYLMNVPCAKSKDIEIGGAEKTPAIDAYIGKDWTLESLAGKPITLSHYKGQPVILVFWATWCPYCKKLLPGIARLHRKYAVKGLKVIAVNIKEDWKPDVYWKNHGYEFEAVLKGDQIAEGYGIKGTPGIVFIAPNGKTLKTAHFSDPNHPSLEKFAQYYLK